MKPGAPLKRTELQRSSKPLSRGKPLARTGQLRSKPKKKLPPAAEVFKNWWIGQPCGGCRLRPAQVTHHIVLAQYLKEPDKWRLEGAMPLCHSCHSNHHSPNGPKLRRVDLPDRALDFATEVLGGRAGSYFARRYA